MSASGAKLFVSRQTVLPDGVKPAVLLVKSGKIEAIYPCANDNEISEKLGVSITIMKTQYYILKLKM